MAKKPKGRTLSEFGSLTKGEKKLLEACAEGRTATLGDKRPAEKSDTNTVRAEFIRFLALGGDDAAPVHERGVQLQGAWIEGVLDLAGATATASLGVIHSHFISIPVFDGARIKGTLDLSGSSVPGMTANDLRCRGNVNLTHSFTSTGDIQLLGARISGDLNCEGAKLDGKDGDALSADSITVRGTFFFRDMLFPVHGIRLPSAKVSQLADDAVSWGDRLILDGFVYDHLAGDDSPTDAPTRLVWLRKQDKEHLSGQGFRPQPWKHLQKALRGMGHIEDARQVAIALEDHLRAVDLIGQTPLHWRPWRRVAHHHIAQSLHLAFKALIGYGYRPLRLGAWMLAVWLACAGLYWAAALLGVMAPSHPLVFQNMPAYQSCTPNWYLCPALPEEYTGFSPLAYSLDVLLPFVNLQQEQDWAPLIPTPLEPWYSELFTHWSFKHVVRLAMWLEILFGWVASLLLVAVVSGLTKRQDDPE